MENQRLLNDSLVTPNCVGTALYAMYRARDRVITVVLAPYIPL
jgi:hypothetical protein